MARKKKKKLPSLKTLKRKADKALSEYARAVTFDEYNKCPFCLKNPIQCCFHFITRRRKIIRWVITNVIGACHTCNYTERYFPDISRMWFIKKFGVQAYFDLVTIAQQDFEPTREYLEGIIKTFTDALREYKDGRKAKS